MNFESNGNNSGIEKLRVVISQKYLPELIVTEIVLLEARQSCVVALDISLRIHIFEHFSNVHRVSFCSDNND